MATANSSAPTGQHLSPRYSPEGHNSPKSRRSGGGARGGVVSPWTQVVRGESESIVAAPSSPVSSQEQIVVSSDLSPRKATSDSVALPEDSSLVEAQLESSDVGNGNAGKRPAWNKPSNGVVEAGPVMGASSWPALSESARASAKSASDSLKSPGDGSISTPPAQVNVQGSGNTSSSHKQVNNNPITSSTPSHPIPTRQKSMKRNERSGGSGTANAGLPQSTAPQGPVMEVPPNNSSPRDHINRGANQEGGQRGGFVPQSHGGNDYPQQRGSYRKGNGGPHSRGDGSHHHNSYGGRRDQDRVNHDWNPHRNFNREPHMPHQRVVPRGFIRPPPHSSAQFITPPHLRPFGNPILYHELAPPVSQVVYVPAPHGDPLRGMPFVAPMPAHPMFFPPPQDLQLHAKIVAQIDYYFSNENLIKDLYLRQNMDEQGWVPVKLIAGFKKVKLLTENIQLILEAVRTSTIVEVQGDKLRKRNDWMKWIMSPSAVQFSPLPSPQSMGSSSHEMLAARFQNVGLGDQSTYHNTLRGEADAHVEEFLSRSSSGDLNCQSKPYNSEGPSQADVLGGPDRSNSAKNFK